MQDAAIAILTPPPRGPALRGRQDATRRPSLPADGQTRRNGDGPHHGHDVPPDIPAPPEAPDAAEAASDTLPAGRPVQLNRQQILDVTARCLRQQGYDATTIRRIAKELGCAVGSIYRYFRDKRELLTAVTEQLLVPAAELADEGLPFEEVARTYLKGAARDRSAYQLMFWLASLDEENPDGKNESNDHAPAVAAMPRNGNGNGTGNGNGRAIAHGNGNGLGHANGNGHGDAGHDADDARTASLAAPAPLPVIVERIITACRPCFIDPEAGRQCWSALHGAVLLGLDFADALPTLRPFLKPSSRGNGHAPSPAATPRQRLAQAAPPEPVTLGAEASTNGETEAEHEAEEHGDVCLL